MLIALFILTMLGIGLWKKKGKEEAVIEQPTPQNTIGIIKTEASEPNQEAPPSDSEEKTLKDATEKSAAPEPDKNPQEKKEN